jgi:TIR domain
MSTQTENSPLRVFYSYAREDQMFFEQLEKHLLILKRQGLIASWFDQQISAGANWSQEINSHLQTADIILLFVSPDFLASDYIYQKELQIALRRHELGEARVIPIILRFVDWEGTPFARYQVLPPDGMPVVSYKNRDEAFFEIVKGIRYICQDIVAAKANSYRSLEVKTPNLEKYSLAQVFVKSGFPHITFVEPEDFTLLKLALQQPGRGVIIEGPSGVGKTTSVVKIAKDLSKGDLGSHLESIKLLSARDPGQRELLHTIRAWHENTVIVDDFHILDAETRQAMVDYLKELADTTSTTRKLAIIGIPRTGQALVDMSFDLATRIDVFSFGKASDKSILKMIRQGEDALNIEFDRKADIVLAANNSLNLAQFLCFNLCVSAQTTETQEQTRLAHCEIDVAKKSMLIDLERKFARSIREFIALGASRDLTCLRLLEELILRENGSLSLRHLQLTNPQLAKGFERFIEEKWLEKLYKTCPEAENYLFYDSGRQALVIDDPQLDFYLKEVRLTNLAREVGKMPFLAKRKVFIGYSRFDTRWLDQLRVHLKPIEREGGILDLWDDTKIAAGQQWEAALRDALETASVVVLLVSAAFLASDFILEGALPALLERTSASGTTIIPLILSRSLFSHTSLNVFDPINPSDRPITGMDPIEQEDTFARVSQTILASLRDA